MYLETKCVSLEEEKRKQLYEMKERVEHYEHLTFEEELIDDFFETREGYSYHTTDIRNYLQTFKLKKAYEADFLSDILIERTPEDVMIMMNFEKMSLKTTITLKNEQDATRTYTTEEIEQVLDYFINDDARFYESESTCETTKKDIKLVRYQYGTAYRAEEVDSICSKHRFKTDTASYTILFETNVTVHYKITRQQKNEATDVFVSFLQRKEKMMLDIKENMYSEKETVMQKERSIVSVHVKANEASEVSTDTLLSMLEDDATIKLVDEVDYTKQDRKGLLSHTYEVSDENDTIYVVLHTYFEFAPEHENF